MSLRSTWSASLVLVLLIAAGCGGRGEEAVPAAAGEAPASGTEAQAAGKTPPAPQAPGSPEQGPADREAVRVAPSGSGTDGAGSEETVRTILVPSRRVEVLSRLEGPTVAVAVEEGDRVAEGQVLMRLDDQPGRLARDRAAAEAQRTRALYLRNLRGFQQSGGIQVVSKLELEVSLAEYRKAQADSAIREMELGYTRVCSPIAGWVIERQIEQGQWAGPGDPLFTVGDLGTLRAVFIVPYARQGDFPPGAAVALVVDPDGGARDVPGRVVLRSPVVEPATGGVKVTVEIDNRDLSLQPGLPVALTLGG